MSWPRTTRRESPGTSFSLNTSEPNTSDPNSSDPPATPLPRSPSAWSEHIEWTARAERFAPLVDGVEYFRAVRESLIRAHRQVLIVGWDFHSEIDLLRGQEADEASERDGYPVRLADLLERVLDENPKLQVSILIWEGSPLFALERQHLPRMKRPWASRSQLTLLWDRDTPPLGSQHQKIVVVDDRVAFVGGMDLTQARWDDHTHRPRDPRRRKPGLVPRYGNPYHDIMLALDGEAARVVGRHCRARWHRASEQTLEPPADAPAEAPDPWPPSVEPLLRERAVAFFLTEPELDGREEKRQVEQSYLAQIRGARELIYIENQYFSSDPICDALCERLREQAGPVVVLVLPHGCPGTLQSMALDTHRDVLLERLREADGEGRLGVYWPTLRGDLDPGEHGINDSVYVHAKTLVVDDSLLRIGSANLANRSMGLDAELDACVWADEDDCDAREAIAAYRRRLLGYLLGTPVDEIATAEERAPSLLAAIDALRGGERTLHPFEHEASTFQDIALPIELADPDRPLAAADIARATNLAEAATDLGERLDLLRNRFVSGLRHHRRLVLGGVAIALLAAVWSFSPIRDRLDADAARAMLEAIRSSRAGLAGVILAFWVGAAVGFPVTLLIATVAGVFGAATSVFVSTLGVAGSASLGFAVGRWLPGDERNALFGGRLQRISDRVRDRSVLALALLRNIPIAPYALVNLACGVTTIGWAGFLAGTLLGMFPGIVLASFFGQELADWLADPTLGGMLRIAGVVALMVGVALLADRVLQQRSGKERGDDAPADESA